MRITGCCFARYGLWLATLAAAPFVRSEEPAAPLPDSNHTVRPSEQWEVWVKRLGAEDFETRQAAFEQLAKAGAEARPYLALRLLDLEEKEDPSLVETIFKLRELVREVHLPVLMPLAALRKKWSHPIDGLLGIEVPKRPADDVEAVLRNKLPIALNRTILGVSGDWFFLAGQRRVVCHSIQSPNPNRPQFSFPSMPATPGKETDRRKEIVWQYDFPDISEERLFACLGAEWTHPAGELPRGCFTNWLLAHGKKKGERLGIENGSLHWTLEPGEASINSKEDMAWLKDLRFASSPTCCRRSLYVLGIRRAGENLESWMICLEADTGKLRWKSLICAGKPVTFSEAIQPAFGLSVVIEQGLAYAVTNLGSVAALNTATGAVCWTQLYERLSTEVNGNGLSQKLPWAPNRPLVTQGLLIVTPQDSRFMYALDLQTGQRKWRTERVFDSRAEEEELQLVHGILDRWLILSGSGLWFINAASGRKEARAWSLKDSKIVGLGVLTRDEFWLPTEHGVMIVDARLSAKGRPICKVKRELDWEKPESEAGNLLLHGSTLFSSSATHVNAFDLQWEVKKEPERQP